MAHYDGLVCQWRECGRTFSASRKHAKFCCPAHKTAHSDEKKRERREAKKGAKTEKVENVEQPSTFSPAPQIDLVETLRGVIRTELASALSGLQINMMQGMSVSFGKPAEQHHYDDMNALIEQNQMEDTSANAGMGYKVSMAVFYGTVDTLTDDEIEYGIRARILDMSARRTNKSRVLEEDWDDGDLVINR